METQFNNAAQANMTVPQPPHNADQANSLQQALSAAIAANKAGDAVGALEYSAKALSLAPAEYQQARVTRGWAIYKAMRQIGKQPDREMLPTLAAWFRELEQDTMPKLRRPDLLFSMLLNEYCRLSPFCPQAGMLPSRIGPLEFRAEDFTRFHPADGPADGFDSLVEKLISAVYKAAKQLYSSNQTNNPEFSEFAQWALALVHQYGPRFPQHPWIPYYQSRLLLMNGKREEARAGIITTLKANANAFWAWDIFGRTFDDPQMQIACLCKALSCHGTPPEFLINVRADLAQHLASTGMQKEAGIEAGLAIAVRQQNKWNVPLALARLAGQGNAVPKPSDNADLYRRFSPVAETAFWSASGIPVRIGIVESNNAEKGVCRIILSMDEAVLAHYDRYPAVADYAPGSHVALRVQVYEHPERGKSLRVLTVEAAGDRAPDKSLARPFEGPFTLNPGGFGFIRNGGISVFVPPPLVIRAALKDGMRTGGMAIHERKRDGVPGWRAVTINNLEGALSRGS